MSIYVLADKVEKAVKKKPQKIKTPSKKEADAKPEDVQKPAELKLPKKLKPIPIQIEEVKVTEAQHAQELQGPQFTQLKLKKPVQKPKQELQTVSLPKVQLKSRIRYNREWPPAELKPSITYLGSVRQNGQLSRNIKEAAKLKKKPIKIKEIPDLDKVELEKPEEFEFTVEKPQQVEEEKYPEPGEIKPDKEDLPEKVKERVIKQPEPFDDNTVEKPKIYQTKEPDNVLQDKVEDHKRNEDKPDVVDIPEKEIIDREDNIQIIKEVQPIDETKTKPSVEKIKKKTKEPVIKTEESKDMNQITEKEDLIDEQPSDVIEEKPKKKKKEHKIEELKPEDQITEHKLISEPVIGTDEPQHEDQLTEVEKPIDEPKSEPREEKPKKKKKEQKIKTDESKTEEQLTENKPESTELEISEEKDLKQTEVSDKTVVEKKPKTKKKDKPSKPLLEEVVKAEEQPNKPEHIPEILENSEIDQETPEAPTIQEPEIPSIEKRKTKTKKAKQTESQHEPEEIPAKDDLQTDEKPIKKSSKPKLTPIKIERKEVEISKPQHAESIEGPQFTKLKLKKAAAKPKQDAPLVTLPKFQLKSRIKYVSDWPPAEIKPVINYLGSVRQNGLLSRNVKEAEKIKKKVYKQPKLPEIEKTELEKPMFGYEDIVEAKNQSELSEKDEPLEDVSGVKDETKEDEPEQFTIKPKRPSIKKTEEIEDEVTIKKKLKAVRKPSVTLPEITEPENVTFRPKSTKTKEDVEQEFNIQLDSYAEEEISMSSKVKLKPQRRPTFSEEANETSIKFYEDVEDKPDIIEIIESDEEKSDNAANVVMPLKKNKDFKQEIHEETSSITVSKPKKEETESIVSQDVSIKLDRKPKYTVDEQEEVSFDIKPQVDQYTQEELSLSSKIKLKPKKKITISEAADETSIQLKQEVEDDSQVEEVIISEAEADENVEMVIKRKPKKPKYEVSEVEELSVEFKPKRINEDAYEEEQLTILAKRKPRKPSTLQGTLHCI